MPKIFFLSVTRPVWFHRVLTTGHNISSTVTKWEIISESKVEKFSTKSGI